MANIQRLNLYFLIYKPTLKCLQDISTTDYYLPINNTKLEKGAKYKICSLHLPLISNKSFKFNIFERLKLKNTKQKVTQKNRVSLFLVCTNSDKKLHTFLVIVLFHIETSHLTWTENLNDWFPYKIHHWAEMGE